MNYVMIYFSPLNPLKGRIVSEICREKLTAITSLRGQGVSKFVQSFIPLI